MLHAFYNWEKNSGAKLKYKEKSEIAEVSGSKVEEVNAVFREFEYFGADIR